MFDPQPGLQAVQAIIRNLSIKAVSFTQTVTIPAGIAGAFVDAYLTYHPVSDANGADIGCVGNTSLSLTSTTLVTEVTENTPDAKMSAGQYWINYLTGHIHICKGDTGTSATITYKIFAQTDKGDGSAPTAPEVSVTNSATALLAANVARIGVLIVNGSAAITLGPSNVTAGTTQTLAPNQAIILDNFTGPLYAITAAGTSNVRILTW